MVSKSVKRKIYLLLTDTLLIVVVFGLAIILVARPGYFEELVLGRPWFASLPVVIYLLVIYLVQGYHLEEIVLPWRGLTSMAAAALTGSVAIGFLFFFIPKAPEFSAKVLVVSGLVLLLLLWTVRIFYGWLLSIATLKENLLLIGTDPHTLELAELILNSRRSAYRVVGILHTGESVDLEQPRLANLITPKDLPRLILNHAVDTVVLGRAAAGERVIRLVVALKRRGLKIRELNNLYEELTGRVPVQSVEQLSMLFENFGRRSELGRFMENLVNRALALALLIVSLPLWPIIIIGQQISGPGPVFVEQSQRVGLAGRVFRFYKFRSMIPGASAKGSGLITAKNDTRVTGFGRFLRKTHLDELPQLINVFLGDLNFIGPRAELVERVEELEKQIPFYHERHLIKPGLTGWAQVRNVFTDASRRGTMEKIQYDLYYLKHRSPALDLAILIRTFKLIIKGRGTA